MKKWPTQKLEQLTTKIGSGATPRGGQNGYVEAGVSLIRSQNILDNGMNIAEIAHITDEAAHKLRGVTVQANDVLINITGDSIARCSIVDERVLPARVNQHVSILRTTAELDPLFLQKFLVTPGTKNLLMAISSGGTRQALTRSDLANLSVPVPPISEQRAIAEVLGALDDKIAANNACIRLIDEHLAAEYERSLQQEKIVEELGVIAEFHNKRRIPLSAKQRDERPGAVPYYGASGVFGYVDEALFDEPLVLVGEDGSVINADGTPVTQYIWGPSWVNNHAHALKGKVVSTELLYYAIRRSQVSTLVTGAVQPKINMGNLKRLQLSLPALESRTSMETIVAAEVAAKRAFTTEKRTLTATRDALLPQLMSGKIRVREAEAVVEDVL